MTMTIGMRLCQLAKEQGLTLVQVSRELGITQSLPCHWANGQGSPNLKNATAFATLVGRRLVAVDAGKVVAEGVGLANLAELRTAAGLSQQALAAKLHTSQPSVSLTERRAKPTMYLRTCQRHLKACGYKVGLTPAAVAA